VIIVGHDQRALQACRDAPLRRFFFSSRRRHTRFSRDWSSDVCSSDLKPVAKFQSLCVVFGLAPVALVLVFGWGSFDREVYDAARSEERRVGEERGSGWARVREDQEEGVRSDGQQHVAIGL